MSQLIIANVYEVGAGLLVIALLMLSGSPARSLIPCRVKQRLRVSGSGPGHRRP
jgi:hypothetical protein